MADEISAIGVKLTLNASNFMAGMGAATEATNGFVAAAKDASTVAGPVGAGRKSGSKSSAAQNMGVNLDLSVSSAQLTKLREQIIKGIGVIPVQLSATTSAKAIRGEAEKVVAAQITPAVGTRSGAAHTVRTAVKQNLPERAYGGPVTQGRSYLVGERRAEVFTPRSSGYVHADAQRFYREQEQLERQHQAEMQRIRGGGVRGYGGKYGSSRPGSSRTASAEPGWAHHVTGELNPIRSSSIPGVRPLSRGFYGEPSSSWWGGGIQPRYGHAAVRTRPTRDFLNEGTYFDSAGSPSPVWRTSSVVPRRDLQYWGEDEAWHKFRRGRARMAGGPVEPQGPLQRRIAGLPPLEPQRQPAPAPQPVEPEWMRRARQGRLPYRETRQDGGPVAARFGMRSVTRSYPNAAVDLSQSSRRDRLRLGDELVDLAREYPHTARSVREIRSVPDREMNAAVARAYKVKITERDQHTTFGLTTGGKTRHPKIAINSEFSDEDVRGIGAYPRNVVEGLQHEFGHAVDFSNDIMGNDILERGVNRLASVSLYGGRGREHFAELFTAHRRGALSKSDASIFESIKLIDRAKVPRQAGGRVRPSRSMEARAIREFGLARDISEAGWLTPSGRMLDFSGRHYAQGYHREGNYNVPDRGQWDYLQGQRNVDHRETNSPLGLPTGWTGLQRLMKHGFIRLATNGYPSQFGGEMWKMPTEAQMRVLSQYGRNAQYIGFDVVRKGAADTITSGGDMFGGVGVGRHLGAIRDFYGQRMAGGPVRANKGHLDISGVEPNLRKYFEAATPQQRTEGADWYAKWGKELRAEAAKLNLDPKLLTSVAASLSPNNGWPGNFHDAIKYARAWSQGLPMPGASTFGVNQRKAWSILQHQNPDFLKGLKVQPFGAALLGDPSAKPQDIWMKRAAVDDLSLSRTKGTPSQRQRREMDRVIDQIAAEQKLEPRQVQAIIWTAAREQGMAATGAQKHHRLRQAGGGVGSFFHAAKPFTSFLGEAVNTAAGWARDPFMAYMSWQGQQGAKHARRGDVVGKPRFGGDIIGGPISPRMVAPRNLFNQIGPEGDAAEYWQTLMDPSKAAWERWDATSAFAMRHGPGKPKPHMAGGPVRAAKGTWLKGDEAIGHSLTALKGAGRPYHVEGLKKKIAARLEYDSIGGPRKISTEEAIANIEAHNAAMEAGPAITYMHGKPPELAADLPSGLDAQGNLVDVAAHSDKLKAESKERIAARRDVPYVATSGDAAVDARARELLDFMIARPEHQPEKGKPKGSDLLQYIKRGQGPLDSVHDGARKRNWGTLEDKLFDNARRSLAGEKLDSPYDEFGLEATEAARVHEAYTPPPRDEAGRTPSSLSGTVKANREAYVESDASTLALAREMRDWLTTRPEHQPEKGRPKGTTYSEKVKAGKGPFDAKGWGTQEAWLLRNARLRLAGQPVERPFDEFQPAVTAAETQAAEEEFALVNGATAADIRRSRGQVGISRRGKHLDVRLEAEDTFDKLSDAGHGWRTPTGFRVTKPPADYTTPQAEVNAHSSARPQPPKYTLYTEWKARQYGKDHVRHPGWFIAQRTDGGPYKAGNFEDIGSSSEEFVRKEGPTFQGAAADEDRPHFHGPGSYSGTFLSREAAEAEGVRRYGAEHGFDLKTPKAPKAPSKPARDKVEAAREEVWDPASNPITYEDMRQTVHDRLDGVISSNEIALEQVRHSEPGRVKDVERAIARAKKDLERSLAKWQGTGPIPQHEAHADPDRAEAASQSGGWPFYPTPDKKEIRRRLEAGEISESVAAMHGVSPKPKTAAESFGVPRHEAPEVIAHAKIADAGFERRAEREAMRLEADRTLAELEAAPKVERELTPGQRIRAERRQVREQAERSTLDQLFGTLFGKRHAGGDVGNGLYIVNEAGPEAFIEGKDISKLAANRPDILGRVPHAADGARTGMIAKPAWSLFAPQKDGIIVRREDAHGALHAVAARGGADFSTDFKAQWNTMLDFYDMVHGLNAFKPQQASKADPRMLGAGPAIAGRLEAGPSIQYMGGPTAGTSVIDLPASMREFTEALSGGTDDLGDAFEASARVVDKLPDLITKAFAQHQTTRQPMSVADEAIDKASSLSNAFAEAHGQQHPSKWGVKTKKEYSEVVLARLAAKEAVDREKADTTAALEIATGPKMIGSGAAQEVAGDRRAWAEMLQAGTTRGSGATISAGPELKLLGAGRIRPTGGTNVLPAGSTPINLRDRINRGNLWPEEHLRQQAAAKLAEERAQAAGSRANAIWSTPVDDPLLGRYAAGEMRPDLDNAVDDPELGRLAASRRRGGALPPPPVISSLTGGGLPGVGDRRSRDEKLRAMAMQTASPYEADTALRMLAAKRSTATGTPDVVAAGAPTATGYPTMAQRAAEARSARLTEERAAEAARKQGANWRTPLAALTANAGPNGSDTRYGPEYHPFYGPPVPAPDTGRRAWAEMMSAGTTRGSGPLISAGASAMSTPVDDPELGRLASRRAAPAAAPAAAPPVNIVQAMALVTTARQAPPRPPVAPPTARPGQTMMTTEEYQELLQMGLEKPASLSGDEMKSLRFGYVKAAHEQARAGGPKSADELLGSVRMGTAGSAAWMSARTPKGVAAVYGEMLGGGAEFKRKQATLQMETMAYRRLGGVYDHYNNSVAALTSGIEEAKRVGVDYSGLQDQLIDHTETRQIAEKNLLEQSEKLVVAEEAVMPTTGGIIKSFGSIIAATSLYGAAFGAASLVMSQAIIPGINKWADQMMGFEPLMTKFTGAMADSTRELGGNYKAALAAKGVTAGLSAETYNWSASVMGSTVMAKAGAKAYTDFSEVFRSSIGVLNHQGGPQGLFGGYGGIVGSPLLGEQLGGGKGLQEQMLSDILATRGQTGIDYGKYAATGLGAGALAGGALASTGVGALAALPSALLAGVLAAGANVGLDIISGNFGTATGPLPEEVVAGSPEAVLQKTLDDAMGRLQGREGGPAYKFAYQGRDVSEAYKDAPKSMQNLAKAGYAVVDANGQMVTAFDKVVEASEQLAKGLTIPDPEVWFKTVERQLNAQFQQLDIQSAVNRSITIPLQLAMGRISSPLLAPGVGTIPGAGMPSGLKPGQWEKYLAAQPTMKIGAGGVSVGGGMGLDPKLAKEAAGWMKDAAKLQADLAAEDSAAITKATGQIMGQPGAEASRIAAETGVRPGEMPTVQVPVSQSDILKAQQGMTTDQLVEQALKGKTIEQLQAEGQTHQARSDAMKAKVPGPTPPPPGAPTPGTSYGTIPSPASTPTADLGPGPFSQPQQYRTVQMQGPPTPPGLTEAGQYKGLMNEAKAASAELLALQTRLGDLAATASRASWANTTRLSLRSIADASDMLSGHSSQAAGSLGAVQRQLWNISRASQALDLKLQGLQIDFQKSMAGFQAPGLTSEQRGANQQMAKIEARIAERKLGYAKETYAGTGQEWKIQAQRNLQDAQAAWDAAQKAHAAEAAAAVAQAKIAALSAKIASKLQQAGDIYGTSSTKFGKSLQIAGNYAETFGGMLQDASGGMGGFLTAIGFTRSESRSGHTTWTAPTWTKPNAAGYLGTFGKGAVMTVGEAGPETVAILRNPRAYNPMGGGGGGFGGGGGTTTVNLTINVQGDVKDEATVAKIVRAVEDSFNRKAARIGMRSYVSSMG